MPLQPHCTAPHRNRNRAGAAEFKAAYEESARDMHDAGAEMKARALKKRGTAAERKAIKEQAEEAERFLGRRSERDALRLQHALFGLYAMDRRIKGEEDDAAQAAASES